MKDMLRWLGTWLVRSVTTTVMMLAFIGCFPSGGGGGGVGFAVQMLVIGTVLAFLWTCATGGDN